jgi:hypothetical protein
MLRMLWRAADNALAETINSLFKAEVIHRRGPWRNYEAVECHALMGQLRHCRRNAVVQQPPSAGSYWEYRTSRS